MECPQCQADSLRVIDSRDVDAEPAIRRRRECERCGFRFTTYERIEAPALTVVKKDGSREPFSREKLSRGIRRACEKRPIPESDIDRVIAQTEQEIRSCGDGEIGSERVGAMVMQQLKELDQIAYIRFASVYREFADLSELDAEIKKVLLKQEQTKRRIKRDRQPA
ncbi:MAG: transcriptional regulator NrdR [Patescibacteria group bacterium]